MTGLGHFLMVAAALSISSADALTLSDCDRTTHISHAGETGHRDFGDGHVGFAEWWSQEGVYTDIVITNCETGESLRTRVAEERISDRIAFDRTDRAVEIIERHLKGSPSFWSLPTLAEQLRHTGEDIALFETATEFCACAALYPAAIGDKQAYDRTQPDDLGASDT